MYIITFYSFKGGVGRTMALVNTGVELARRGRKVLLVDFDLEAPGLTTYDLLRSKKPHPGIVEFVTEFRNTRRAPLVTDFVSEARPVGKKDGKLWVMPAGRGDAEYRRKLNALNWRSLYEHEEGFLFFEDTRLQWEAEYHPDYVLIDARTGHTDIEGICTRQLADAVVVVFYPNEQNLAGLKEVCRHIRAEETSGLKKKIHLHFVASNVPDLDDENRHLRRHLDLFRTTLAIPRGPLPIIRRSETLQMLEQPVFVLQRPYSRLARSYRRLVRTLIKANFADREGALAFLEDYAKLDPESRPPKDRMTAQAFAERFPDRIPTDELSKSLFTNALFHEYDEPLEEIAKHFSDDVEVLSKLADYCTLNEDFENAVNILDRVLQLQPNRLDFLMARALCRIELGEIAEASEDLLAWIHRAEPDPDLVKRCLSKLRKIAPHRLTEAATDLAAQGFPGLPRYQLAEFLCDSEVGIMVAAQLLRESLPGWDKDANEVKTGKLLELLMRARCWQEVIHLLEKNGTEGLSAYQLFCLALAYWGEKGEMPESLCQAALERGKSPQQFGNAVYSQAMSWLHWRIGNKADASRFLNEAEAFGRGEQDYQAEGNVSFRYIGSTFSLWRYRFVSIDQFLDDCQLVRRMICGEPIRPAFLGPQR